MEDFIAAWPAWLIAITGVISAATAITAITPSKADDKFIGMILKALNVLAGNVAKNVNKDAD